MAPVGVMFGGPSPEHDVSILTGLQASRALSNAGEDVRALYWSKSGEWFLVGATEEAESFIGGIPKGASRLRLEASPGGGFFQVAGRLSRDRPVELDVVLVCCHGGPGEDGTLQGLLDLAGIRYAGPSAWGAAVGMDKLAFSGLAATAGLAQLPRILLDGKDPGFAGPYLVKPRFGGSSIGIEVVEDLKSARDLLATSLHLRRGAVVEPWRPELRDLNIAVRTWPEVSLSAIEMPLRSTEGAEILTYADKYVGGEGMASAPRKLPADVSDEVASAVRSAAESLVELAGVRGVARVDFLYREEGELYLNELNTIPGSLARYLWVDPEVPFDRLLADALEEGRRRPSAMYSSAGSDGAALRSAGSIQGKLS